MGEPRAFTVTGKVTESMINKMEQAKILNADFNFSHQINRALELMYTNRDKNSKYESFVVASLTKNTLLEVESLQNRVNMRQMSSSLYVSIEMLTLKIRVYPKSKTLESDLRDLARVISSIREYSTADYEICHDIALKLLKKGQKTIFQNQIQQGIQVYCPSHIIGGCLDEQENDISGLVHNCLTVPKNHREAKIDDTLHYIAQHYEDSHIACEAFLNELERAEHVKN